MSTHYPQRKPMPPSHEEPRSMEFLAADALNHRSESELTISGLRRQLVETQAQLERERQSAAEYAAMMDDEIAARDARIETLGVDKVTGLPTRRKLEEEFTLLTQPHELQRRNDSAEGHSVIFIDADNFGQINKTFGEPVGDKVLGRIGEALRNRTRRSDVIGRYGGEELLVIAPNTSIEQAMVLAEGIRAEVEQYVPDEEVTALTVSVGVGNLGNELLLEDAVVEANQAMRAAKLAGKNQVVSYDDLPETGN